MRSSGQEDKNEIPIDEPINYILYKSVDEDDARDMLVINGQSYYRSTGVNSSLPGIWLPFLATKGSVPVNISLSDVAFTRFAVIGSHAQPLAWIIKKAADNVEPPSLETSATWCAASLKLKIRNEEKAEPNQNVEVEDAAEAKPQENKQDKIFDRLYLKSDFITALRLTDPLCWQCDMDSLYQAAGLTKEEVILSKTPLKLDSKPKFETDDSDEINAWLIEQGAVNAKRILQKPPASYQKMWIAGAGSNYEETKAAILENKKSYFITKRDDAERREQVMELGQAKAILIDYIKNDWMIVRLFTIHLGRHHIKLVREALENKELNSAIKLITHIRCTAGAALDPKGSLARRLCFIEQQLFVPGSQEELFSKANEACVAVLLWENKKKKALEEERQKTDAAQVPTVERKKR